MIRFAGQALDQWLQSKNRKPLVIRGARQVGKTWLVRDLTRRHGLDLVELNFERSPQLADLFAGNDPVGLSISQQLLQPGTAGNICKHYDRGLNHAVTR